MANIYLIVIGLQEPYILSYIILNTFPLIKYYYFIFVCFVDPCIPKRLQ